MKERTCTVLAVTTAAMGLLAACEQPTDPGDVFPFAATADPAFLPGQVEVCKEGPSGNYEFTITNVSAGVTLPLGNSFTLEPDECKVVATATESGRSITVTETSTPAGVVFANAKVFVVTPGTPPTVSGPTNSSNPVLVNEWGDRGKVVIFENRLVVAGAVVLLIDEDGLDNGLHYNQSGGPITPSGPQFFTKSDVNDGIAGEKQRSVLRYFALNIGRTITVRTGQTGDEGWFAPNCIPAKWIGSNSSSNDTCLEDPARQTAINNYFGVNGSSAIPSQSRLDKIPHVIPLRALGLNSLIGKDVCAVVYDSDASINYDIGKPLGVNGNLQGATLGIVAFHVNEVRTLDRFSSSTLPEVQITILSTSVCGNWTLFNAPVPSSSSVPNDRVAPGSPAGYHSLTVWPPLPLFY